MRQFMPSGALGCHHVHIACWQQQQQQLLTERPENTLLHQDEQLLVYHRLNLLLSCHAGAVVLSNGNGTHGVATSNGNTGSSTLQLTSSRTDADLAALSLAMGYNQNLFDINILSFDITPTVSGPITFSYVFASEEYQEYSPTSGENTTATCIHLTCREHATQHV
jgi:hypothetical protein